MALGSDRYRTETTIRSVTINDRPVDLFAADGAEVKCGYGQPVRFEVTCSGRLPATGLAVLKTEGRQDREVVLKPRANARGLRRPVGPPAANGGLPDLRGGRPDAVDPAGRCGAAGGGRVLEVTPPS